MDNHSLHNLNDAQREAVLYTDGPQLVIAGAGSGKTRVLTYKIAYLLSQGYEPWRILALTFTIKAANEMKERIAQLVGTATASRLWMGTFHSIFFQILSQYEHYKTSDILTVSQKKKYLKTILLQMNYQGKLDTDSLENILSNISYYKNQNNTILFGKIEETIPQFGEIYERYEKLIRQEHKLDFDDMM